MNPATHTPTAFAVMLEYVRQSGRWNMLMDFRRACAAAVALGVYLHQPIALGPPDGLKIQPATFVQAYRDKAYAQCVAHQAAGLPASEEYRAALARVNKQHAGVHVTAKRMLEEAEAACLQWAYYAHDKEGDGHAGVTSNDAVHALCYGAARLQDEGVLCDYVLPRIFAL